jgi:hypothetical protein
VLLVLVFFFGRGFGHELFKRHEVAFFFGVAFRLDVVS